MTDIIPRCAECRHLRPKSTCGQSTSPHFDQVVKPDGFCNHFSYNPAEGHLNQGMILFLEGKYRAAIDEFKKALEGELPEDHELTAYSFMSSSSSSLIGNYQEISALVRGPEIRDAIAYMERAVRIDRSGQYDYFSDRLERSRLQRLDLLYTLVANEIEESESAAEAIRFLENRVQLFDYLPSPPLLQSLLSLGVIYGQCGYDDKAQECFEKILAADPVDPIDEAGKEQQTRRLAQENLELAKRKRASQQGCFIASASMGSLSHPDVVRLRNFRDQALLVHPFGRRMVACYYRLSPPLADFLKACPPAKFITRHLLIRPIAATLGRISPKGDISRGETLMPPPEPEA